MSEINAPLRVRIAVAKNGLKLFFTSYRRILGFLLSSTLGFALINALFDIELLWTLLTLDVPLSFRLEAIRDVLFNPSGLPLPNIIAIYMMAVLFGYVVSASITVALRNRTSNKNASGGVGILFGIISGGCAACGTSILAPLLTAIGITSTSAALEFALLMNLIGITVLLYSTYKVSLVFASLRKDKNA